MCGLALDESGGVKTAKDYQFFEGEVLCFNRKGKQSMVWNIELRLGWTGELKDASGATIAKGNGVLSVYELSEEALEDGLDITVELTKGDDALREVVKAGSARALAEQGQIFRGLLDGHMQQLLAGGGAGGGAAGGAAAAAAPAPEPEALSAEQLEAARLAEAKKKEEKAAAEAAAKAAAEEAAAEEAAAAQALASEHRASLGPTFAAAVRGELAECDEWGLAGCGMEDGDLAELVERIGSSSVKVLDLQGNALTDAACQKLCVGLAGGGAAQLSSLRLAGNPITEKGRIMFDGLKMMRSKTQPFEVLFD